MLFGAYNGQLRRGLPLVYVDANTLLLRFSNITANGVLLSDSGQMPLGLTLGTQYTPSPISVSFLPTLQNSPRSNASSYPAISISRISGCTVVHNLTTSLCEKTAVLTVTGTSFPLRAVDALVTVGTESCGIIALTATRLTCNMMQRGAPPPTTPSSPSSSPGSR